MADSSQPYRRPIAGYIPEVWPAVVAIVVFGILTAALWTHYARKAQRYALTLTIGGTCIVLGYAIRIGVHYNAYSIGVYSISTLFILLSPCAWFACIYMLLSRMARYLDATDLLLLPANWITKIFVTSDVITFMMQGAGGGLTASSNPSSADLGHKLAMAGLIIQAIALLLYTFLLLFWGYRLASKHPQKWRMGAGHSSNRYAKAILSRQPVADWRILFWTIATSMVFWLWRSAFRIAEYNGGYNGTLMTTEWYFYVLDALPLAFGLSLFVFVWPPRYLDMQELLPGSYLMTKTSGSV